MDKYFSKLNILPQDKIIKEMRKYAKTNKVPIINDDGLAFILKIIELVNPKKFLEIGTAIGFCCINLAVSNQNILVDTIERDEVMYNEAIKNIKAANLDNRIRVFHQDALEIDLNVLNDEYDVIFIDGAKAQYIKFFEKFEGKLSENGIIITDNLLFHGLVSSPNKIKNRNLKQLVQKIDSFNSWLSKNKKYNTSFFDIGDGIAVSKKVNK